MMVMAEPLPAKVTKVGCLLLDHDRYRVTAGALEAELTRSQYAVLRRLTSSSRGAIVRTDDLILALYADGQRDEPDSAAEVLRYVIRGLRDKLHAIGDPAAIRSVRGLGYTVEVLG